MWCVGDARCATDDDDDGTIVTHAARELVDGRLVVCVATRRARRRRRDDDGGGLNSRHPRRSRDDGGGGDGGGDDRAWAAMTVDADRTRRDVRRARGIELASTREGMRERMKRALEKGEARVDARGVTTTTTASSAAGGGEVTFRWVTRAWDDEEAPRGYVETLEWINEALAETRGAAARRDARGGGDETAREDEDAVRKMVASPVKGTTSIGRWLSERRERVRLAAAAASEDGEDDEDEATRRTKKRKSSRRDFAT